jgi:ketosteroid isomerase-like protein
MTEFAEWQDCQVYGYNCQLAACLTWITSGNLRDASETLPIFYRSHPNPLAKQFSERSDVFVATHRPIPNANLPSFVGDSYRHELVIIATFHDRSQRRKSPKKTTEVTAMNTNGSNTERILEIFRRIEERDPNRPNPPRVFELFQSDFESYWPPSLPYGSERGVNKRSVSWEQVWNPLQPTVTERRMDPRVIAGNGDEMVVLWRQRGLSHNGERYEGEVLGLYNFREGKLARAQMFYFDLDSVASFLSRAKV